MAGGPYVDTAHACSCAGSWTYEEALRRSDAAFSGEVAGIGELPPPEVESNDGGMAPFLAPVTFDVNEAWKGVQIEPVVVYGQDPSASCGLDFERDDTYLVFAYHTGEDGEGPLQADSCGNTVAASEETARNILGPPPPESLPETGGVALGPARTDAASTYVRATVVFGLASAGVLLAGRAVLWRGR